MSQKSVEEQIRQKLLVNLRPIRLDVINDSERHAGHRSSPGTGNSHFQILIVSPEFVGKSRIERHRLVNSVLAEELSGPIHALGLKAFAPGELFD